MNIAPLYYQQWNHSIFAYPNNAGNTAFGFVYGSPRYTGVMPAGFAGTIDGNLHYRPTWAVEIDYGGELVLPSRDGGNPTNGVCYFANGTSNGNCTEQTVYAGITSKF